MLHREINDDGMREIDEDEEDLNTEVDKLLVYTIFFLFYRVEFIPGRNNDELSSVINSLIGAWHTRCMCRHIYIFMCKVYIHIYVDRSDVFGGEERMQESWFNIKIIKDWNQWLLMQYLLVRKTNRYFHEQCVCVSIYILCVKLTGCGKRNCYSG